MVLGCWGVLDPLDKISMSRIRNCKIDNRIFIWGLQNERNKKQVKYVYFLNVPTKQKQKQQFKYVCLQRYMPETVTSSHSIIFGAWRHQMLVKRDQTWAGVRSGQNGLLSLLILFENEPDLSWSGEWSELITFLVDSYWKQSRSAHFPYWFLLKTDQIWAGAGTGQNWSLSLLILIKNKPDMSPSEELSELITLLILIENGHGMRPSG